MGFTAGFWVCGILKRNAKYDDGETHGKEAGKLCGSYGCCLPETPA